MIAAVEDPLSEAVLRRVVAEVRPDLTLYQVMRRNGAGYVRSKMRALNQTARKLPVFVLLDLDRPDPCPADLISELLPIPLAPKLLVRIAVMEVESWVIADGEGFAKFMGVARTAIPHDPDAVLDPKRMIVTLARGSKKRDIREDLAPRAGDVRQVGPGFNPRLIAFVENDWSLEAAVASSRSFGRAVERLRSAF